VLISYYHGPWLVCVSSAIISMSCLVLFLKVWHPKKIWTSTSRNRNEATGESTVHRHASGDVIRAWTPWVILTLALLFWGLPQFNGFLTRHTTMLIQVPNLHNLVQRVPPAVPAPRLEAAVFTFNWLAATGTAILFAAIIGGLVMGCSVSELFRVYGKTLKAVKFALLTICAMVAIGYSTRYGGLDATMGLAFAKTGVLYPLFGCVLGWIGVAASGSDSSANALFGSLQRLTAEKLGISPILMASANTTGGVMGKMISGPSAVVAATATNWHGHESDIFRYVFLHSIVLVFVIGLWLMLLAYVYPFNLLIVQ
jgi:lactate permease